MSFRLASSRAHPPRCASRSFRHPSDRVFPLGAIPGHHRGSGHLPYRFRAFGRAQGEGDSRFFRLRFFLRLRDLRGWHRPLLGSLPGAGVSLEDPTAAAPGGAHRAWTRRHRRGVGFPVRAGGPQRQAFPGGAAQLPGLDLALRVAVGARSGGGGLHRRLREAVPDHRRSQPPGRAGHFPGRGSGGGAGLQQRDRGKAFRVRWQGVHGARAGVCENSRGLRQHRGENRCRWGSGAPRGCGPGGAGAGNPPGRSRSGRSGGSRGGDRGDAPRGKRAQRDPRGEGQACGACAVPPRRRGGGHHLRSRGPHQKGHRHAQARAFGRDDHRELGDPAFPVARPFGAGADPHDSRFGLPGVHSAVFPWRYREHHVAGWHRHFYRRPGGRRHRGGGKRLQQDPPLAGRRSAWRFSQRAPPSPPRGGPFGFLLAFGDCRGVFAGLRAGGTGGPAVQAVGLLQELGYGAGGDPRRDPGSGDAHALRPHRAVFFSAEVSGASRHQDFRRDILRRGKTPGKPRFVPHLRAGLPLRVAPHQIGDRCCPAVGGGKSSGVFQAGARVHAAVGRRHDSLHAHHAAGDFRHRSGKAAANPGPHPQIVPRGRKGFRQGRARGNIHRSGAVFHDGNHGGAQARGPVAQETPLVLFLGPGAARLAAPPPLAGSHQLRGAGGGKGPGAAHPRGDQRLDHAHQGAH